MTQEAIENVVRPGYLTVSTVDVSKEEGADIPMTFAVTVKSDPVSPFSLCRKCLYRMEISPLAKVVLAFLLEAEETGECRRYTYADLGLVVNRCEHSVKEVVASLRGAGLVITMRAGERGMITFTCGPFVSWAARLLQEAGLSSGARESRVSETGVAVTVLPDSVSKTAESVSKPRVRRSQPRRRKSEEPAAKKEGLGASLEEQLHAAREQEVSAFRQEDGSLYPGVWLDDEGRPHFDTASGHPVPPCLQAAAGEDVDPRGEIAGTLRAAGRTAERTADDDDDEFSLGSDTAETDMGHGVKINPDI